MDFINKKNRIRSVEKTLAFRFLYDFTHFFDTGTDRTQYIKRTMQLFSYNHCQSRLPDSRRSPQNKRRHHSGLYHFSQHFTLSHQMLLPDIII